MGEFVLVLSNINIIWQKSLSAPLNQIKSLLLSHHHSTSALVSEILMSVLQTVQKNNRQFTYGQTVQKNHKQFTYGQTVQKNCTGAFTVLQTVQKKKKNTTTAIYIWTDSAKKQHQFTYGQTVQKNNINLHMDSTSICKLTHQLTVYQTRCLPLSAALVPVVCPQPGNPCERRVWRCEREKQHKKYITK